MYYQYGHRQRSDVRHAIRTVLIKTEGNRLSYTTLYGEVNEELRLIRDKPEYTLSPRDFTKEVNTMVREGRLKRIEHQESKKKIKPVEFLLTENDKKEYQRGLLGISTDQAEDRRKKLFQLLFFYEASHAGRITLTNEEDFDSFLKMVSLSRKNLRVAKTMNMKEDQFVIFQTIKGIEISRLEKKGPPDSHMGKRLGDRIQIVYGITLPGFTFNEIWKYYEKNQNNKNSPLAVEVFSHIKFSYEEVRDAFTSLRDGHVIKPILLIENRSPESNNGVTDKRFVIADGRVKSLAYAVWELFGRKLSLLSRRHSTGEFDHEKHRSWLVDMFGEQNADNIIKEWEMWENYDRRKEKSNKDEHDKEMEKGFRNIHEIQYNMLIRQLIKDYKAVLREYEFLSNLVYSMLL